MIKEDLNEIKRLDNESEQKQNELKQNILNTVQKYIHNFNPTVKLILEQSIITVDIDGSIPSESAFKIQEELKASKSSVISNDKRIRLLFEFE